MADTPPGATNAPARRLGLLSVVAPMHDEERSARAFYDRVSAALAGLPYELVLVDDGSRDATPVILAELAAADARVKVIRLARNFGHQAALTAGLEHAAGDAVVMIDGDLQDPPELIPEMLDSWRGGSDVVYAVRHSRAGEKRLKLWSARMFYGLFRRLANIELAPESGDFRLMDRRPLDVLLAMPERNRFLRGMTVWVGFDQTAVAYHRQPRHAGETHYTLARMLRLSFDAISSFSLLPLQLATLLGFLIAGFALFVAIPLTILARYTNQFVPGISSTIVVLLLLGGIQLITVGIIGEYVGRIYEEVKRRPLYVVAERVNVAAPHTETPAGAAGELE